MLGNKPMFNAPKTERSTDSPKPAPKPKPSDADWIEKQRNRYVVERRKFLAKKLENGTLTQEQYQAAINALYITHTSLEWQAVLDKFKNGLQMEFVRWLNGESDYNLNSEKTPWGTKRLVGPGINEYLKEFINNKSEFNKEIAVLKATIPSNITEAWKYFRYIVIGDKTPDADFLADFNTMMPYATNEEVEEAKAASLNKANQLRQFPRWYWARRDDLPQQQGRPLRDWNASTMIKGAVENDEDENNEEQTPVNRRPRQRKPPSSIDEIVKEEIRKQNRNEDDPDMPDAPMDWAHMEQLQKIEGVGAATNKAIMDLSQKFDNLGNMLQQFLIAQTEQKKGGIGQQEVLELLQRKKDDDDESMAGALQEVLTPLLQRALEIQKDTDDMKMDMQAAMINKLIESNEKLTLTTIEENRKGQQAILDSLKQISGGIVMTAAEVRATREVTTQKFNDMTGAIMESIKFSSNPELKKQMEIQTLQMQSNFEKMMIKAEKDRESFIAAMKDANDRQDPDAAAAVLVEQALNANADDMKEFFTRFEQRHNQFYKTFADSMKTNFDQLAKLKTDELTRQSDQITKQLETLKQELTAVKQRELTTVQSSLESVKKANEEKTQLLQELRKQKQENVDKFRNLEGQINIVNQNIKNVTLEKKKLEEINKNLQTQITSLQSKPPEVQVQVVQKENPLNIEAQKKIQMLQTENDELTKKLREQYNNNLAALERQKEMQARHNIELRLLQQQKTEAETKALALVEQSQALVPSTEVDMTEQSAIEAEFMQRITALEQQLQIQEFEKQQILALQNQSSIDPQMTAQRHQQIQESNMLTLTPHVEQAPSTEIVQQIQQASTRRKSNLTEARQKQKQNPETEAKADIKASTSVEHLAEKGKKERKELRQQKREQKRLQTVADTREKSAIVPVAQPPQQPQPEPQLSQFQLNQAFASVVTSPSQEVGVGDLVAKEARRILEEEERQKQPVKIAGFLTQTAATIAASMNDQVIEKAVDSSIKTAVVTNITTKALTAVEQNALKNLDTLRGKGLVNESSLKKNEKELVEHFRAIKKAVAERSKNHLEAADVTPFFSGPGTEGLFNMLNADLQNQEDEQALQELMTQNVDPELPEKERHELQLLLLDKLKAEREAKTVHPEIISVLKNSNHPAQQPIIKLMALIQAKFPKIQEEANKSIEQVIDEQIRTGNPDIDTWRNVGNLIVAMRDVREGKLPESTIGPTAYKHLINKAKKGQGRFNFTNAINVLEQAAKHIKDLKQQSSVFIRKKNVSQPRVPIAPSQIKTGSGGTVTRAFTQLEQRAGRS